jgi:hypothetical protein
VNPPVDDLSAFPVINWRNTSVAANQSAYAALRFGSTENPWRFGRGDGSGGFLTVAQFAIKTLPATGRWFVGLVNTLDTSPLPEPFSTDNGFGQVPTMFGVGQDQGDTVPQFMFSDAGLTLVKSSAGIASLVGNRICEIRLYSDPEGTGNVLMSIETLALGASTSYATFDTVISPGWDMTNAPFGQDWTFYYWTANGTGGGQARVSLLGFFHEYQPIL